MIVGPHPLRREVRYLGQRVDFILRQPVVAHRAVEVFDISILLRLPGLNVFGPDILLFGPALQLAVDVFQPVVPAYNGRLAAPLVRWRY